MRADFINLPTFLPLFARLGAFQQHSSSSSNNSGGASASHDCSVSSESRLIVVLVSKTLLNLRRGVSREKILGMNPQEKLIFCKCRRWWRPEDTAEGAPVQLWKQGVNCVFWGSGTTTKSVPRCAFSTTARAARLLWPASLLKMRSGG